VILDEKYSGRMILRIVFYGGHPSFPDLWPCC
jgi:hypothetical protein